MDKTRKKAESSKEGMKSSEQPWTSHQFRKTGQLIKSDWQILGNKLVALQDANSSTTDRTKKLQQYKRDLENYKDNSLDPSNTYLSALLELFPNNIDDKHSITQSLKLAEDYKKNS